MSIQQDQALQQNEAFLRKAYKNAVLPCMLSILCGNITILADGILVGQKIGVDGLAAVNLCVPVSLVLCVVGSFLVSGTAIQSSRAIGQGKESLGQRYYCTSILAGAAFALIVTVLGLLFLNPIVTVLGADAALRTMVYEYTAITLIGALPKILLYVPFWFLRLDGRNRVVTWMMLVMGLGNVVLDLFCLYVLDMGVAGAAWASILSTAAACVLGFVCLCDSHSGFQFHLFAEDTDQNRRLNFVREKAEWNSIASAGSPSALNNLSQTFRILAVNTLLMRAGGSTMVAVFSAVNCISAFSQCVTDGVPQAASAMLGVYSGERDNGSAALLLRRQWKTGVWYSTVFSVLVILGADLIAGLYGLEVSIRFPLICLAVGMFPALGCSILSGYYNVSGHALLSNVIIFSRVFVFSCGSLFLLVQTGHSPWLFLISGEVLTLVLWYGLVMWYHGKHPEKSRYFLMDQSLEKEGRVLNFSVAGTVDNICDSSARISDFCEENEMNPKQIMRLALAIEELLTLILEVNGGNGVVFDVRVFCVQGVTGIRVRYNGKEYNPFQAAAKDTEDLYLGIRMLEHMVEHINYQRTFGMNTVQLLL